MPDLPLSGGHDDLERLQIQTERGVSAIQALLAIVREFDRDARALIRVNQELEARICRDPLTNLINQYGLEDLISREEARARRFGSSVAVVALDDPAADGASAPRQQDSARTGGLAAVLRRSVRASDVVARVGGGRFVVLLLGTDFAGARVFVERMRAMTLPAGPHGDASAAARIDAGIAVRSEVGSINAALDLASERLQIDRPRAPA